MHLRGRYHSPMATVLIRNLDDRTIEALRRRAAGNGRSLQAELHRIIERAAAADPIEGRALADRIRRKLSGGEHSDSSALIAEDRGR
jgi:antitoxin FitA